MFSFKTLLDREKSIGELQSRNLRCSTFKSYVAGQDVTSQPLAGLPFTALRNTFTFTTDVWIPSVSLGLIVQGLNAASPTTVFFTQMLNLTFNPSAIPSGLSTGLSADPSNELASLLGGWTGVATAVADPVEEGAANYGTKFFNFGDFGYYVPANKPIYLFLYSFASAASMQVRHNITAAIYYLPIPS